MSDEQKFSHTVLPREENKAHENLGNPGIHIPQNAEEIKEFSQIRNVDAKELNAKIHAAEQEAKAKNLFGADKKD